MDFLFGPRRLDRSLSGSSHKSKKSVASATTMESPPSPGPDPLPTNKTELEGLRNFHVSQLEALARRVKLFNEHIDLDSIVLSHLQQEDKSKMAATVMQRRVDSQLRCKRDLAASVTYHREELKKVLRALMKEKNGEMKEVDGEDILSTINGLPTPNEWSELFKD